MDIIEGVQIFSVPVGGGADSGRVGVSSPAEVSATTVLEVMQAMLSDIIIVSHDVVFCTQNTQYLKAYDVEIGISYAGDMEFQLVDHCSPGWHPSLRLG